jgi:hypothetical protein
MLENNQMENSRHLWSTEGWSEFTSSPAVKWQMHLIASWEGEMHMFASCERANVNVIASFGGQMHVIASCEGQMHVIASCEGPNAYYRQL